MFFNHDQGTPERIEYESILHATRYKARHFLTEAKAFFKDESPEREYLISRGYCHLVNAFVIGAPIDALNWMCLKGLKLEQFNNWGQVLFYMFKANDRPYLDLLDEFIRFQRTSTWTEIDDDPWPSKTMDKLMTNMVKLFNEYRQDKECRFYLDDRHPLDESTKTVLDSMESIWGAMVMVVGQGRYDQIEDDD